MRHVKGIRITCRGYADGIFEIRTSWDGEVLTTIPIGYTNVWEDYEAHVEIPDGINALYLTFRGEGNASLKSFALLSD